MAIKMVQLWTLVNLLTGLGQSNPIVDNVAGTEYEKLDCF